MNNDLISRSKLKKAIEEQRKLKVYSEADERQNVIIDCILYIIDNAPTVEEKPQGEWISVSERLPIRNGCYNVTRIIEGTAISDVCYFDGQNTWHDDTRVNHGRPYLTDITAWQPLSEPYKKGEQK